MKNCMRTLETLAQRVNGDPAIVRWGRRMNETFMVEVGDTQFLLTVRDGNLHVEKGPFTMRSWRFAIRAKREAWEDLKLVMRLLAAAPAP